MWKIWWLPPTMSNVQGQYFSGICGDVLLANRANLISNEDSLAWRMLLRRLD